MARRHRHLRMAHSTDNTNSQNKNITTTTEMERVMNNYVDNNYTNPQTSTTQTVNEAVNETNTPQTTQTTEITKTTEESTTGVIRSPTLRARRYPSPRRFLVNTLTQQSQSQQEYENYQDYQSNYNNSKCNSSRSNNINNEDDVVDAMFHTPLGPSSISASPNTTLIHNNSRSDTFNDKNENIVSISNYGYNYPSGGNNVYANESTNVNDRHRNRPSYLFPSHSTDSVSSTSHTSNHSYQYQLQYHNNDIDNMNADSSIADKSNTSGRGNVKYVLTSPVSTVPSSLGRHSQTTSAHTTSLSLPISPTGASPTTPANLYSTGSGGMSIIYPRKGKVGPYYGEDALHPLSHNDEDNMGEVASQQNMELAEVQVEGYFAQSLGVLIPNDLPRSTLMYVLTASDGRDSMFKLIQYTLQLTICFLKTPELFSSEAQVLTEAWAERFYKNYNTIRHGRSLFKIGRGMLNLFTIQSVMERLWLKYEDKIFNRMTGAPSQTPNAISPSVPLLQSSSSYEVEKRTRTHFSYSYRLLVKIVLFVLGKMLGLPVNNFAQKWKQALLIGGTDSTLTSPVGMFPQRTTQHYLNEGYIANDTGNTVTASSLPKNVNEVNKGKATLSTTPLLSTMPSNVYMHVAKVEQQPVEELTTTSANTNSSLPNTNYNTSNSFDKSKQMSVLYFDNKITYSPQYISLDSFKTPYTTSAAGLENNKWQETNMLTEKESKACTAVPLLAENTQDINNATCTSNKHSFSSDKDANTLANSTTLGEDSMNVFAPPPPIISSTLPSHYNEGDMCANVPTHSLLHNTNTEKDKVGVMENKSNMQKAAAALQKGDPLQFIEQQPQTTLLQPLKDKKSKQSAKASKKTEENNTTAESSVNTSRNKKTELITTSAGTSFDEPFYGTHAKETQFFSSLEDTPHNMFRTKAPSYSDQATQENKWSDNNNNIKSKELELTKAQVAEQEEDEEVKHMAYFAPLYSTESKMANELVKGENHVVENNNNTIQDSDNTENKLEDHHNASIMSFASMSENSDAHANSSHQITELIPASQAEPIM